MKHISPILIIAFSLIAEQTSAQCTVVSDTSGTIQDGIMTTSINYSVSILGAGSFANLGAYSLCALSFYCAVGVPSTNRYKPFSASA